MKKYILLIAALFLALVLPAQTTLSAGDIAFLGSNTDNGGTFDDNVTFVLLKDIDDVTTIIFTDRGWNDATNSFTNVAGDGELTWSSGMARSAGDIITLDLTFGALSNGGSYAIQGDQLFAIQGSIASPTFIAGLHFNVEPLGTNSATATTNDTNWDGTSVNADESDLPNALITGDTAVRLTLSDGAEGDNFRFSCTTAGASPITGTPAQIRAILHNRSNWDSNTLAGFNPPVEAGCTVTIAIATDNVDPVITCAPTPANIVAGIDGMAAIPDLVTGTSATDNESADVDIIITQNPPLNTMVNVGVHNVILTALDKAGNTATCNIDVTIVEPPSTSLSAGDIAFVGFNLDGNEGFAFVLLKDIIAGTNIKLTDCGVTNPNTINCVSNDSVNTWYAPSNMSAGDIVTLNGSFFSSSLAIQGDQIFAFQGTTASPIFLAGIHSNIESGTTNNTDWDGTSANNDESALPNQLINGVNAIRLHSSENEIDNWRFDCTLLPAGVTLSGSPSNIAAIINNLIYWESSDTTEFNPTAQTGTGCIYNVVVSSDTTDPVISDCGSTPPDITADVLGNATVPDLTGSVVATDDMLASVDLTILQSPSAGTTITAGVTSVTLFVSDEAGNTATCTIDLTVVNIVATTLAAGDIAFVGINQDGNDGFAFIILKDILAGTMINFTDCGVDNPNTIDCSSSNDSSNIWFSPTNMSAGSIVELDNSFGLSLSSAGDQILAYQGDINSPTFLAGIHTSVILATTNGDWDGANTSQPTSALPDQLTNGVNAIRLYIPGTPDTESDNWQFDCTAVPGGLPVSGTPQQVAAIINDIQYWINNNTTPYDPVAKTGCTYNLDPIPPTAICKNITIQLDAAGTANIVGTDVDNDSSDNVGIISYSVSPDTFDCTNLSAPVQVTLTVVDAAGNTATCTADVTVEDKIKPSITCPGNQFELADVNCQVSLPNYTALATVSDNCTASPNITQTPPAGTTISSTQTVTLRATDASGNFMECSFDVIVIDNIPPVLTIPEDARVECNNVPNVEQASAKDNCDSNVDVVFGGEQRINGDCTNNYTLIRTWTATDVNNNKTTKSQIITVEDTTPPVAPSPPANLNLQCASDVPPPAMLQAMDNCDGVINGNLKAVVTPGSCTNSFTIKRTWSFTDSCNNSSSVSQTINVNDDTPPVAPVPPVDLNLQCADNIPAPADLKATDSCDGEITGNLKAVIIPGSCINKFTVIRTWSFTDSCNNSSSVSQTINVNDDVLPTISCPLNIIVDSDNGTCGAIVTYATPLGTDNCAGATTMQTAGLASGAIFPIGTTTNTFKVTDACGNTATCSFDVTVNDNENPTITCPLDIVINNTAGNCNQPVMLGTPTYSDNCPGATVSNDAPAAGFPFGSTKVTWTVTDASNNTASCIQTVTINKIQTTSSVTVTPSSQQYSDLVKFDATLSPGSCVGAGNAATTVEFFVGTQSVGTANLILNGNILEGTLTAPLLETPSQPSNNQMSPGNHTVTAVFGGKNVNFIITDPTTNLTITKENAIAEYTGQMVQATAPNSTDAEVLLSFNVQDISCTDATDPNPGDIRNAIVEVYVDGNLIKTFSNKDGDATNDIGLINPADTKTGTVSVSTILSSGADGSESYTVRADIKGYYTGSTESVINIYEPEGDYITGGGYIVPDNSSGTYASTDGLKTNFGFNVRFNKKGNKLKGHMNIIFRRLESDGLHKYQIKGNAIQSLGIDNENPEAKFAEFITKANLTDITDPLNSISLGGNLTLKVEMTDRGEPGTDDSIGISLTKRGRLLYSSNWSGINTEEMTLSGGNIIVERGIKGGGKAKTTNISDNESSLFDVVAKTNPFNNKASVKVKTDNTQNDVEIHVYDINNKLIHYSKGTPYSEFVFGDNFEAGVYIVKVKQAGRFKIKRLVKN